MTAGSRVSTLASTAPAIPQRPRSAPRRAAAGASSWQAWGLILIAPYVLVFAFVLYPVSYGLWLARHPAELRQAVRRPDLHPHGRSTRSSSCSSAVNLKMLLALWLSGFFVHERVWIRWLSVLFLLPWAVPSIPTILSIRFMLNPEWGVINSTDLPAHRRRRAELAQRPAHRAVAWRC